MYWWIGHGKEGGVGGVGCKGGKEGCSELQCNSTEVYEPSQEIGKDCFINDD